MLTRAPIAEWATEVSLSSIKGAAILANFRSRITSKLFSTTIAKLEHPHSFSIDEPE